MITPSFGLTATERVLPKLALDFTTASLDPRVTFTRALNTATRINASGYVEVANADVPRFNYDPITKVCKGLLIEESRENSLTYSEDISSADWNKSTGTIQSGALSPNGVLNADSYVQNTGTTSEMLRAANITITADKDFAISGFFKATGNVVGVRLYSTAGGNGFRVIVNLLTGGVISASALGSGTYRSSGVKNFGNGWYYVWVSGRHAAGNTTGQYRVQPTDVSGNPFVGDGTSGISVWGTQFEKSTTDITFPTSYIPTEATAVTRNADVATMTGTNFSDFYNAAEGTFAATFLTFASAGPNTIIHAGTNSNFNDRIALLTTPSNFVVANSAGVNQATLGSVSRLNVESTMIGAYKENDFAWAVDGNTPSTDASGVTPSPVAFCLGYRNTASPNLFLNGLLRKVSYWPQRLTNNEVQAFSKG
jgi:hypothetical protein